MRTKKVAEFRTFAELQSWHRARRVANTQHTVPISAGTGLKKRAKLQTR